MQPRNGKFFTSTRALMQNKSLGPVGGALSQCPRGLLGTLPYPRTPFSFPLFYYLTLEKESQKIQENFGEKNDEGENGKALKR